MTKSWLDGTSESAHSGNVTEAAVNQNIGTWKLAFANLRMPTLVVWDDSGFKILLSFHPVTQRGGMLQ